MTKNSNAAALPLTEATAAMLREYFAYRVAPADAPALPVPMDRSGKPQTARMIQFDAKAAGVAYETPDGVLCFHCLRHGFVSNLLRTGASLKVVQELAPTLHRIALGKRHEGTKARRHEGTEGKTLYVERNIADPGLHLR